MNTKIIGTGSAVPSRVLDNAELSTFLDTSDEWIRTRTGIRSRHIAQEGQTASALAAQAAKKGDSRCRDSGRADRSHYRCDFNA